MSNCILVLKIFQYFLHYAFLLIYTIAKSIENDVFDIYYKILILLNKATNDLINNFFLYFTNYSLILICIRLFKGSFNVTYINTVLILLKSLLSVTLENQIFTLNIYSTKKSSY